MGYAGRLRAAGPLIADQFRYGAAASASTRSSCRTAVAERQPEAQWRLRPQGSYQDHLMSR